MVCVISPFEPRTLFILPFPYEELVPYYLDAEQIMNVNTGYARGSSIQEILLRRLRSNGFPAATDTPLAVDLESTKYGQIHSNAFFSSLNFLAYALNNRPFDLAVNTSLKEHKNDARICWSWASFLLSWCFVWKKWFEHICRRLISRSEGMAVNVHCYGDAPVTKPLRNDFSVYALVNQNCGRSMPEKYWKSEWQRVKNINSLHIIRVHST